MDRFATSPQGGTASLDVGFLKMSTRRPGSRTSQKHTAADRMSMGGSPILREDSEDGLTPFQLVDKILASSSGSLEKVVLTTFPYFMAPLQLMEQLIIKYTEGPSLHATEAQIEAVENRLLAVRLRVLNFLRKWVKTHRMHFDEPKMKDLLRDFLECARLTGNARIVEQIEGEIISDVTSTGGGNRAINMAWPMLKATRVTSLEDVACEELARQLSLADSELYKRIPVAEFLQCKFMKNPEQSTPNMFAYSKRFNHVAKVVIAHILGKQVEEERTAAIAYWIGCARHLRMLHNYHSLLAVVGGLSNTTIVRLKSNWDALPAELVEFNRSCIGLMDRNFSGLRAELSHAPHPAVPYIGAFQRDLVYVDEQPTWIGSVFVNVNKFRAIASALDSCLAFQNSSYSWFTELSALQEIVTKFETLSEDESHERSLALVGRGRAKPVQVGAQLPPMVRVIAPSTTRAQDGPPTLPKLPTTELFVEQQPPQKPPLPSQHSNPLRTHMSVQDMQDSQDDEEEAEEEEEQNGTQEKAAQNSGNNLIVPTDGARARANSIEIGNVVFRKDLTDNSAASSAGSKTKIAIGRRRSVQRDAPTE